MADTAACAATNVSDFGLPATAINALCGALRQYPQVMQATVYGSRAKGNFRPGSDLDLTLDGPELMPGDLLRISAALDDLMLPWKIDLSLLPHIHNPELLAHIARVGKPLCRHENQNHAR